MTEAPIRTKIIAGACLVCVSTSVGVVYKISQKTGGFHYSTTSAIAMSEIAKLIMSTCFHIGDSSHHKDGISHAASAWNVFKQQVNLSAAMHIALLGFLYTVNNQLTFATVIIADPGTVFLFKAASTMIVATIQILFVGKRFSVNQWKAMFLQANGMIIVQYNPCKSTTRYAPMAYALMSLSAIITSTCAVRNEYLVKNYAMSLNVQNMLLYAAGALCNIGAFLFVPNPNSAQANLGFFDGYDNPLALAVVFVNSLIGLAITAVYKYADAVTKCFATDITAVLLCIISTVFFELQPSITMWCGVIVVCYAVHNYTWQLLLQHPKRQLALLRLIRFNLPQRCVI